MRLLRGYPLPPEIRYRDESGEIKIEKAPTPPRYPAAAQGYRRQVNGGPPERAACAQRKLQTGSSQPRLPRLPLRRKMPAASRCASTRMGWHATA